MKEVLRKILKKNLGVKKDEKVLVLTDIHSNPSDKQKEVNKIAAKTAETAKELSNNVFMLKYPSVGRHSAPLPDSVKEIMLEADVILGITWFSVSHTEARRKASKKGARIATTPGIEKNMIKKGGSVDVDYDKMKERGDAMIEALKGKNKIRIKAEGTDLELSIKGRRFENDHGILNQPGAFGNLPAGEVMGAPIESSAEGVLKATAPRAELTFKEGKVIEFEGENGLKQKIMKFDHRRTIAELGIGTNPNAENPQNALEAEKILGTVHVAVGDNTSYPGGKNKSDQHVDFIIFNPTLIADGEELIKNGEWVV